MLLRTIKLFGQMLTWVYSQAGSSLRTSYVTSHKLRLVLTIYSIFCSVFTFTQENAKLCPLAHLKSMPPVVDCMFMFSAFGINYQAPFALNDLGSH